MAKRISKQLLNLFSYFSNLQYEDIANTAGKTFGKVRQLIADIKECHLVTAIKEREERKEIKYCALVMVEYYACQHGVTVCPARTAKAIAISAKALKFIPELFPVSGKIWL